MLRCGSWYRGVRRRAAELPTVHKAGSNRATGRAGWLRLARHGSACRGLHHPRVLQRHPGRAAWQVGAQLSPATARSGLATQRGLADLHAVSFKTWTQVSKTQSILWGEGHKDRSEDSDGDGALAQDTIHPLLPSPLAGEAFRLPSSEAVCLQLDRSSASPACLLHFLILGVGLSKSRAEPPWDQGEAGAGGLQFQVPFFFSPSFFTLHTKLGYDETPALSCSQNSCTAHAGNNCPWWSSASCRML